MSFARQRPADIDPRLEQALRYAVAIGAVLVLLWPGARGQSAIGWLPLWLLGMPLSAWWALHRFALPRLALRVRRSQPERMRRAAPPARRRVTGARHRMRARAA